jgi:hypothetical protein
VKNYTTLLIAIILVLVALFLSLYVREGERDFLANQEALIRHSTRGAARMIELYLEEIRRRVRLFAEEESGSIGELATARTNTGAQQRFTDRVKRHFPGYFTYTITDADARVELDDFEGRISELCQTEIRHFIQSGEQTVVIHPNPEGYHFDIMSRWQDDAGRHGVFLNQPRWRGSWPTVSCIIID